MPVELPSAPQILDRARRRDLLRNPLNYFLELTRQYGDVVCYRAAPEPAYLINHPDYVRHVLIDNNRNYSKGTYINEMFKTMVADGLLTSEGETWRRHRRLIQPAFNPHRLAILDSLVIAETNHMLERWQAAADGGRPVPLSQDMAALTLAITTQALFGVNLGEQIERVGQALDMGGALLEKPKNPKFKAAVQMVADVVDRIIASRRAALDGKLNGESPKQDLLGALMQMQIDEPELALNDAALRDQVITLLLAGYETTASALTWTFYALSQNPAVMRRLCRSLEEGLCGRTPRYDDLTGLAYNSMVFAESLRLHPPAWILGRVALGDDQIGDYFVPAGTILAISPYTMHRHLAYWDDPEIFDPERFTEERSAERPRFAYIPFGSGPRLCIGKPFAMLEAQLVIAMVIQRFELELVHDHELQPQVMFVLRPDRDMKMMLRAVG